jgi:hypothetical protein
VNTISKLTEDERPGREDRVFEVMLEAFITRYRPTDPLDGATFDMAVHTLVRNIYRDAQAPLLAQIAKMIGASLDLSHLMPRAGGHY